MRADTKHFGGEPHYSKSYDSHRPKGSKQQAQSKHSGGESWESWEAVVVWPCPHTLSPPALKGLLGMSQTVKTSCTVRCPGDR